MPARQLALYGQEALEAARLFLFWKTAETGGALGKFRWVANIVFFAAWQLLISYPFLVRRQGSNAGAPAGGLEGWRSPPPAAGA